MFNQRISLRCNSKMLHIILSKKRKKYYRQSKFKIVFSFGMDTVIYSRLLFCFSFDYFFDVLECGLASSGTSSKVCQSLFAIYQRKVKYYVMRLLRRLSLFKLARRNLTLPRSSLFPVDPVVGPRTTILLSTKDRAGALNECLPVFSRNGVNLTKIESKYAMDPTEVQFVLDMGLSPDDPKVRRILEDLTSNKTTLFAKQVPPRSVPWFPMTSKDVDSLALLVLEGGIDLENKDHPGFHDPEYRKRRKEIAEYAATFQYGGKPEMVKYTKEEIQTWGVIWRKLEPLLEKHACDQYLEALGALKTSCGYREDNIPQLADVSEFIRKRTGFQLRPTAGLLSSRHFLNGLAFNEIGLASIGATDEQLAGLARCYWFSVEFGLCRKKPNSNERKIYGAGILSSFGEIEYSMSDKPEIRDWDPFAAAQQDYPITTYQPLYYMAESFESAKQKLQEYATSLRKPFSVRWDNDNQRLVVDSNVVRQDKSLIISSKLYFSSLEEFSQP
ncbi:phenylalanine 4-monooxygenase [Reticulomyxa filosa]|uniref:phenylalanine 4-monooxygenase n=1 Tax=Reticulomyxa filosa TaxID=46433 RepID=X6NPB1_RETFI|nr:phenylalanine 4-monooxygenase [Reticulomyxa filosa]|eukprot:ETO27856.1 phenylalanine 4-monooxygenase [Reticulomyxa filosa]